MHSLTKLSVLFALVLPATNGLAAQETPVAKPVATATFDQSHKLWSEVLTAHVKADGFDYKALKADRAKLDAYVASLEAVKPDDFARWSAKEQFAFWIDAYNAYTIRRVVDSYPIASIKDLGDDKLSVWDRDLAPLGALAPDLKKAKLTLNDIENKILRPKFKDARVHAAINCASQGCPPLRAEAITAEKLDKQLDDQVKHWLADTTRNRFDKSKGVLELSSIFDWFKDDFIRDAGSVQGWLAQRLPDDAAWLDPKKKLEVKFLDYSWKLNAAK